MLVKSNQSSPLVKAQQVQPLVGFDTGDSFIEKFGKPTAAYSLRDLNDKQGNNTVIRVRRGSDDSESDFLAKELTDGTLEAFVRGGYTTPEGMSSLPLHQGFVIKWFDQSGNNKHAEQTDPNKQPLVTYGTNNPYLEGVLFDGASGYFDINGGISLSNGTPLSVFCVQTAQTGYDRFTLGSSTTNRGISFKTTKIFYFFSKRGISIHAPKSGAVPTTFSVIHDGTSTGENVIARRSGSQVVDSTPDVDMGSEQFTNSIDHIGYGVPSNYLSGILKELIIYTTDKTSSRGAIEANMASGQGIPFF